LSLAEMSDPTVTDADARPARYLRLVKGVYIPDDNTHDFLDRTAAFGRSDNQAQAISQGMREILGYVPIEADGSALTKVPANVPFTISVVDKDGRRIGGRHQNWMQLRAGEVLECNGCHDHNPTAPAQPLPHGYTDAPTALNTGAPTTGVAFTGTTTDIDPVTAGLQEIIPDMGETMAEARIRSLCPDGSGGTEYTAVTCPELSPSIDPDFTDVWANGAVPDVNNLRYTDLTTTLPDSVNSAYCQPSWTGGCRTVINYATHIHPLWSVSRAGGTRTCTICHTNAGLVPAAQLDLTDGPSDQEANHLKSYRELLFTDNQVDINGLDVQVFTGYLTDPDTGDLVLDAMGNPVPVFETIEVQPSMSLDGSRGGTFMSKFLPGGSHEGDLTPAEIRLISEWLDNGAQYFNNPFDAPVN